MGTIVKKGVVYSSGKSGDTHAVVELTQAEYDALGSSKYNDNITYFITDGKGIDGDALKNIIADEYSESKTYEVGDLCFKDNILYMCISPILTPESWNNFHWSQTTVGEILSILYKTMRS